MTRNLFFILTLLFFYSCTGLVQLSSYGLSPKSSFVKKVDPKDIAPRPLEHFRFQRRYNSPWFWKPVQVVVREELAKEGIDPQSAFFIRYEIRQDFWDVVRSFLPFLSSTTVVYSGYYLEQKQIRPRSKARARKGIQEE